MVRRVNGELVFVLEGAKGEVEIRMRRWTSRSRVGRRIGVDDGVRWGTAGDDGRWVSRRATGSRVDFGGREVELSSDFDDSGDSERRVSCCEVRNAMESVEEKRERTVW